MDFGSKKPKNCTVEKEGMNFSKIMKPLNDKVCVLGPRHGPVAAGIHFIRGARAGRVENTFHGRTCLQQNWLQSF